MFSPAWLRMMPFCLITGDIDLEPVVPARFHHCNDTYCLSLVISKYLGDYTLRFCVEISCFSLTFTHQLAFLDGSCLQQLLMVTFIAVVLSPFINWNCLWKSCAFSLFFFILLSVCELDVSFILWPIMQCCCCWFCCLNHCSFGLGSCLRSAPACSSSAPVFIVCLPWHSGTTEYSPCIFSPQRWQPLLQRPLVPFTGRWYLEAKLWALSLSLFLNWDICVSIILTFKICTGSSLSCLFIIRV